MLSMDAVDIKPCANRPRPTVRDPPCLQAISCSPALPYELESAYDHNAVLKVREHEAHYPL